MIDDVRRGAYEPADAIAVDDLMAVRGHLRIVHDVAGRLRVRMSKDACGVAHGIALKVFRRFVARRRETGFGISTPTVWGVIAYDREPLQPAP